MLQNHRAIQAGCERDDVIVDYANVNHALLIGYLQCYTICNMHESYEGKEYALF